MFYGLLQYACNTITHNLDDHRFITVDVADVLKYGFYNRSTTIDASHQITLIMVDFYSFGEAIHQQMCTVESASVSVSISIMYI